MTPESAAAILNVHVSASRAEILTAYSRRARMTHPDRFAGAPKGDIDAATAEFVRVTAARDLLLAHAGRSTAPPAGTAPQQQQRPQPQRPAGRTSRASTESSPPPPQPASPQSSSRIPKPDPPLEPSSLLGRAVLWIGGIAALIVVVVIASYAIGNASSSDAAPETADHSAAAIGETDYDGSGQVSLTTDGVPVRVTDAEPNGGWAWTITSSQDCPGATVTVGLSNTADGDIVENVNEEIWLTASEPYDYQLSSSDIAHEFAVLSTITCRTD
jgi:hypothetical protein